MNTMLWILQIVLAVSFAGAGAVKLVMSQQWVSDKMGDWAAGGPAASLKLLGVAEVAAAIGLTVPPAVDIAPWLAPLAAAGVIIVMVGAIVLHSRRKEYPNVAGNLFLAAAAAVVIWGRLGPYSF